MDSFRNLSRREFVKGGLAVLGMALAAEGCSSADSAGISQGSKVGRWAFLSDLHIAEDINDTYRGFSPRQNLETVVSQVVSMAPDGVAITGDLARQSGQVGDYQQLKALLAPLTQKSPIYVSLGNHDHRDNFRKVFNLPRGTKPFVDGKYVVVAETQPVRVIQLDTLFYSGQVAGFLGTTQRKWLADTLSGDDNTPTILCLHHLYADGKMDLLDLPWLYDIVVPNPKVKAIVYGHTHEYGFSEHKEIHLINLPAIGYNFNDKDAVGWVEAQWTAEGGDFTLHAVGGNREKDGTVTKLVWRS
jgi:3',5'-cyclic-AMP phosphodiesterase